MDNEVKTGELSVSLKKRTKNSSCCDYGTGRSKDTLQQTRPDQFRQTGKEVLGNSGIKTPEYRLSRRPVKCRISLKKDVFDHVNILLTDQPRGLVVSNY
jgi:hypothetical protein